MAYKININEYYKEIYEDYKTYSDYYYVKKIKRIDDLIYKIAKNQKSNTYDASQKIIELTLEKAKHIHNKQIFNETLKFLNSREIMILNDYFLKDISAKVIAQNYNVSMRTIFRKISGYVDSYYLAKYFVRGLENGKSKI